MQVDDAVLEDLVQRGLHVNIELVLIGGPDEHILVLDDVLRQDVGTVLSMLLARCRSVNESVGRT